MKVGFKGVYITRTCFRDVKVFIWNNVKYTPTLSILAFTFLKLPIGYCNFILSTFHIYIIVELCICSPVAIYPVAIYTPGFTPSQKLPHLPHS